MIVGPNHTLVVSSDKMKRTDLQIIASHTKITDLSYQHLQRFLSLFQSIMSMNWNSILTNDPIWYESNECCEGVQTLKLSCQYFIPFILSIYSTVFFNFEFGRHIKIKYAQPINRKWFRMGQIPIFIEPQVQIQDTILTHISPVSHFWDVGKQCRLRSASDQGLHCLLTGISITNEVKMKKYTRRP